MSKTWFVLQCKTMKEEFVYNQLCARQIETFYQKVQLRHINPQICKFKPYFPGYLFICVDLNQHQLSELRWLPGVVNFVSFGSEPASVPCILIHAIRQKVNEINTTVCTTTEKQYQPGDNVAIHRGPLGGRMAIFDSHLSGTQRVRVLLECLYRQILVDLPVDFIKA